MPLKLPVHTCLAKASPMVHGKGWKTPPKGHTEDDMTTGRTENAWKTQCTHRVPQAPKGPYPEAPHHLGAQHPCGGTLPMDPNPE